MFWMIFYFAGATLGVCVAAVLAAQGQHSKCLNSLIWALAFASTGLLRLWGIK
jgi:hypothetical protein